MCPDERLGEIDEALGDAAGERQVPHQNEEWDRHQHEVVDALPKRRRQRSTGGSAVGANHKPTMVEQISTIAIGRRRKNSAKKTMMTYQRPPIRQAPKPALGGSGSRPMSLPISRATVCTIIKAPPIGTG